MNPKTRARRWLPWGLLVIATAGCASGRPSEKPSSQLEFGVDMARRGLWNEALFRFEQAGRLAGASSAALNNLAVAYEAVGRFDDALSTYRQALETDPGNRALKQNYSRFLEFYQAFRPKKPAAEPAPATAAPLGAPPAVEPDEKPAAPPAQPAPEEPAPRQAPPAEPQPPTPPPSDPPPAGAPSVEGGLS